MFSLGLRMRSLKEDRSKIIEALFCLFEEAEQSEQQAQKEQHTHTHSTHKYSYLRI